MTLPARAYLLLHCPRSATVDLARYDGDAWCVATEIDHDSTVVGGSAELIDAVVRSRALEVWPMGRDDSLAANADLLNPVLTPGGAELP